MRLNNAEDNDHLVIVFFMKTRSARLNLYKKGGCFMPQYVPSTVLISLG
ncbi:hypothetical protein [Bacillus swezeyi]|nr:hypothetical protein [Bacillus swezeyi]